MNILDRYAESAAYKNLLFIQARNTTIHSRGKRGIAGSLVFDDFNAENIISGHTIFGTMDSRGYTTTAGGGGTSGSGGAGGTIRGQSAGTVYIDDAAFIDREVLTTVRDNRDDLITALPSQLLNTATVDNRWITATAIQPVQIRNQMHFQEMEVILENGDVIRYNNVTVRPL
jgi:hypothetical protein